MTPMITDSDQISRLRRQELLGLGTAALGYLCILAGNFILPLFGADVEIRVILAPLTVLLWFMWWSINVRFDLRHSSSGYILIFWISLTYIFVRALTGPALDNSKELLTGLLVLAAVIPVILDVFSAYRHLLQTVFPVLLAVGYIYAIAGLLSGPGLQGRYSAFGGGPNVFGRIVGFSLIALIVYVTINRRYWLLLSLPLPLIALVLSGSRGAMLSAALAATFVALMLLRNYRFPQIVALTAMLGALLILAAEFAPPFVTAMFEERIISQTIGQRYDSGRSELYDVAWSMFERNPLTGVGVGGYYEYFGASTAAGFEYAHNIVLQVLAEMGLSGFVVVLLPLILVMLKSLVHPPTSMPSVGMLGLTIAIFVSSMFSGGYYDFRYAWLFAGLLFVSEKSENVHAQTETRPRLRSPDGLP